MRKVPKGKFSLQTQNGRRNHLLISTVTGVAPFVSYVRTLHQDWKEGRFPKVPGDEAEFIPVPE